jgi:predicted dehydrogenase
MEKLKVGIIGAGKMGLLHACIFNNLENSKLTAICEKKTLVSTILKKFVTQVNIYRDFGEMLDKENLDVVVITTPVFLHKTMIECAMDHNLHIFVEKPLVMNSMECHSLLIKKSEKQSLVGYCRRFMETYNLAKKIIEKNDLGVLHFFHSQLFIAQVFKQENGWQYNREMSGGGVLMDHGSHAIDLFHYLFGEIDVVHACGKPVFNKDVEDYVSINLKFKNGIYGSLQLSWSVRNYRLPELKLQMHFEKGVVTVTEKYVDIYSEIDTSDFKKGSNIFYKQNLAKNVPINVAEPEYTVEDLHLLNCILDRKRSSCDIQEAAKVHYVIDKIYSSINNNRVEGINYQV